jgi:hypothetical protein
MRTTYRAGQPGNTHGHTTKQQLDFELAELERQKLVMLRGGTVRLTRQGYDAITKRFPRRP